MLTRPLASGWYNTYIYWVPALALRLRGGCQL